MAGLKTIFTHDGTPIADIRAAVVRSWMLNDIGEAIFSIATSDVKCRREILEFGNYILVQHDTLNDWVGIIDTPRVWHHGYIEIHAFEVPYILQWRLTPLNVAITGTPGARFTQLLDFANQAEDTLIRAGIVDTTGTSITESVGDSIYAYIKKMATDNGRNWICTPQIDTLGKLSIVMDWIAKAGTITNLELAQGINIQYGDTPLEEAGELVSSLEAMSDVENNTATAIYTKNTAFGLRQKREVYSGIVDVSALLSNATEYVNRKSIPDITTALTAVNVGQTFANIRLGNVCSYKYTNVGFDEDGLGMSKLIRIEGYRFDESMGTCELYTGKVT